MRRILLLAAATSALLALPAPALAGPQEVAGDIAGKVMSPFCPGVTLESCPSAEAVRLRANIARKAAAGWSEGRIMSWLHSEYGDAVRATPPAEGVGLLAWVLPAAAVAAGAALAVLLLRRWTPRRRASSPAPPAPAPGDRERLERELEAWRRRA